MKTLLEVFEIIAFEVQYAQDKWEKEIGRPVKDEGKSIEFWIAHMENYLQSARQKCYGLDKSEALTDLRKLAGLVIRCFMFQDVPKRKEYR